MPSNPNKLVVPVIGLPFSGKSEVCRHLAGQGFEVFTPSRIIRAFAESSKLPLQSRQDYLDAHLLMNQTDPIAIIRPVLESTAEKICIDGLRSPFLLEELRRHISRVEAVALPCPIEVRWQRAQASGNQRAAYRRQSSLEDFRSAEEPEYRNPNRNMPNMLEMLEIADHSIDASQPSDAVLAALDSIISHAA